MIFYDKKCHLNFLDFGILIPIEHNRSEKILINFYKNYKIEEFPVLKLSSELLISKEDLLLAHNQKYVEKLYTEESLLKEIFIAYELVDKFGNLNRYDPKISTKNIFEILQIAIMQTQLTYEACIHAIKNHFSYFLGGGMHHALSFSGNGFCLINDIAIAILKLKKNNLINTAWIIDVDAHKGDGTAEIMQKHDFVKTLSIHQKNSWPLDESNPFFEISKIKSTLDIDLEDFETNENYLLKLKQGLDFFYKNFPIPEIALIVNGSDPYEKDELKSTSKLNLTKECLLERDKMLFNFFYENNIPQIYVMAGGYGKESYEIYLQFLNFVGENSSIRSKINSR